MPRSSFAALPALALAVGLALPGHAGQGECTEDAMLVFDASGSMAEMGFNGLDLPRIMEARLAVRTVMPRVEAYRRIGLVTYGPGTREPCSNVTQHFPPIPNAAHPVVVAVENVSPDGETPLTEAVGTAVATLGGTGVKGQVVLVTDGRETCGGAPCQLAAEIASETGITVHVIGFKVRGRAFRWADAGSEEGVDHGRTVARCLADYTGGTYVNAESTAELIVALQQALGCPFVGGLSGGEGWGLYENLFSGILR